MFLRYLLFITIIIVFSSFIMILVKDTGDSRKKLEKRLKLKPDEIEHKNSGAELKIISKKTKATKQQKK